MTWPGLAVMTLIGFGLLAIWALWDWLWEHKKRR